jgi:hypothetical protein
LSIRLFQFRPSHLANHLVPGSILIGEPSLKKYFANWDLSRREKRKREQVLSHAHRLSRRSHFCDHRHVVIVMLYHPEMNKVASMPSSAALLNKLARGSLPPYLLPMCAASWSRCFYLSSRHLQFRFLYLYRGSL